MPDTVKETLLDVQNLKVQFHTDDGTVTAVDDVRLRVGKGESLGIVGESGCGKSVTSMAVMRLLKTPPAEVTGQVLFEDKSLLSLPMDAMRAIRGNEIAMIFQEPMTSLNPIYTCGYQIMESIMRHQGLNKGDAREKAIEMLRLVGIPLPEKRVDAYPHQFSGGMRQRVMIAMALSCRPKLLIADEPTTALDVTIQAQILELIKKLKKELDMAVMLITHDLGVVAEMTERVVVMYAGQIVEEGGVVSIFKSPLHPYTQGLLKAIPQLGQKKTSLSVIEGVVPSPFNMPKGCRFAPRCTVARPICREQPPGLTELSGRSVRCWNSTGAEQ